MLCSASQTVDAAELGKIAFVSLGRGGENYAGATAQCRRSGLVVTIGCSAQADSGARKRQLQGQQACARDDRPKRRFRKGISPGKVGGGAGPDAFRSTNDSRVDAARPFGNLATRRTLRASVGPRRHGPAFPGILHRLPGTVGPRSGVVKSLTPGTSAPLRKPLDSHDYTG